MKTKNNKKGSKFESLAQRTIASGGLWFQKGDIHYDKHCAECKYTDKKGYRITTETLEKLWNDALNQNKLPLLVLGIKRSDKYIFLLECKLTIKRKL